MWRGVCAGPRESAVMRLEGSRGCARRCRARVGSPLLLTRREAFSGEQELIDVFMFNVQLVVREQALISGVSVTDASRVIFCYSKFDSEISCLWDL